MPYKRTSELPDTVKSLPKEGQEMFLKVFNSAYEQYKDREDGEQLAFATAWNAIKAKYKKEGDKWVAKEASMIQTKLAELIQEASIRKDDGRANKVIAMCQPLLLEDKDDENAIKQIDEVMAWLKEQEMVKTEDGVKYPAEAYAYVPDKEQPSTWKLRLWEDLEKKVTRAQLGRAAAALSPGGFRGQRVEIPAGDLPAVKRKIRAEYKKLGVEDEDIPRWVKESERREVLTGFVPMAEAKLDKGIATVTIIKPGFNVGKGRYYPAEVLKRDYKVFEGAKMYADHPTEAEDKTRPERSIRDWVGTLTSVEVKEDGTIIGKATIVEPWLQEKLARLRDSGMLSEMGISINAIGSASDAEIEGVKTKLVERLIKARSVDFVTEAGAGGSVDFYESERVDIDLIELPELKDRRPDLIEAVRIETKNDVLKEVKQLDELKEKITELEKQIGNITAERDVLKAKIAEAEKAQRVAETKAKLDEALLKSELPEPAKSRIMEKFQNAESAEGIEEAIKAEADYIAKITEAGKVRNMGETKIPDKGNLKESFRKMHPDWTEAQLEIAVSGR
ncbi:MAG: ChaB family protein [Methanofastidiosum sp.]